MPPKKENLRIHAMANSKQNIKRRANNPKNPAPPITNQPVIQPPMKILSRNPTVPQLSIEEFSIPQNRVPIWSVTDPGSKSSNSSRTLTLNNNGLGKLPEEQSQISDSHSHPDQTNLKTGDEQKKFTLADLSAPPTPNQNLNHSQGLDVALNAESYIDECFEWMREGDSNMLLDEAMWDGWLNTESSLGEIEQAIVEGARERMGKVLKGFDEVMARGDEVRMEKPVGDREEGEDGEDGEGKWDVKVEWVWREVNDVWKRVKVNKGNVMKEVQDLEELTAEKNSVR